MAAIYRTISGSSNVHILHIVTWQPNASRMSTPGGRACVPRRGDAFSPSPPIPEASPVSPRPLPLGVALLCLLLGGAPRSATAQAAPYDSTVFAGLKWRAVRIFRGGRAVALAGSASPPHQILVGSTGGGGFHTAGGGGT